MRLAEAAERAARDLIGGGGVSLNADVIYLVGSGGVHGTPPQDYRRERGVSPAVQHVFDDAGGDLSVLGLVASTHLHRVVGLDQRQQSGPAELEVDPRLDALGFEAADHDLGAGEFGRDELAGPAPGSPEIDDDRLVTLDDDLLERLVGGDLDDDRHLGGPGMVDGLERLGHDPVVGGHDKDHDVGGLGAAGMAGQENGPRNVVIEFPSYDEAVACYNSPEYQAAKQKRKGAGTAEIVIVEGV